MVRNFGLAKKKERKDLVDLVVMRFELNCVRLNINWRGNVELKRNFEENSSLLLYENLAKLVWEDLNISSKQYEFLCLVMLNDMFDDWE